MRVQQPSNPSRASARIRYATVPLNPPLESYSNSGRISSLGALASHPPSGLITSAAHPPVPRSKTINTRRECAEILFIPIYGLELTSIAKHNIQRPHIETTHLH